MPQPDPAGTAVRRQEMPLGDIAMAVRGIQRRESQNDDLQGEPYKFELVFSAGAGVRRYDWYRDREYIEELVVSDDAINLDRLQRGAPLLNSHWSWSLEDQIGVVRDPQIRNGQGTVMVQMSRRDSVRGIVQDIDDGVINNASVGYTRDAVEMIAPAEEGGTWTYRVTRWTPMEVSMVVIPADMACQVVRSDNGTLQLPDGRELRSFPCQFTERHAQPKTPTAGATAETRNLKGATMADETQAGTSAAPQNNAPASTPETRHQPDAVQAAVQAERQRAADIRSAGQAASATLGTEADAIVQRCIDAGSTADEARRQILDALAARSAETATRSQARIETVRDETETTRRRMSDAILLRAVPHMASDQKVDQDGARAFRGMNLIDLARASIRSAGGNPDGMTPREIGLAALNCDKDSARAAGMHSTSDLPVILGNTINRVLQAAYQLAPRTFTGWARQSTNRDFREKAVAQLSALGQLKQVVEGGEYQYLQLADSAEKYALSKFGGIIAITWESLINDDLQAFARLPLMLANKAATLEGDLVYGALLGNAAMADGVALFHGDHKNLLTGAALTADSLSAARAAMRKQTGPDGSVLNLVPSVLIVGPDNEQAANQYTSASFVAAKSVDINPAYNTSLSVVVDARITGKQWYLAATPALVDTVEYSYLEGEQGLFTERREGFEVDGVQIKARHVFGAKAIDHRGLVRNPGA